MEVRSFGKGSVPQTKGKEAIHFLQWVWSRRRQLHFYNAWLFGLIKRAQRSGGYIKSMYANRQINFDKQGPKRKLLLSSSSIYCNETCQQQTDGRKNSLPNWTRAPPNQELAVTGDNGYREISKMHPEQTRLGWMRKSYRNLQRQVSQWWIGIPDRQWMEKHACYQNISFSVHIKPVHCAFVTQFYSIKTIFRPLPNCLSHVTRISEAVEVARWLVTNM